MICWRFLYCRYKIVHLNCVNNENPMLMRGLQEVCLWSHPIFVTLTSNRTFCAGLRDENNSCNGDSGSGLILFDATTNRYQLRGIVSRIVFGNDSFSCDPTKYVVYVDVAKYVSWIQQQIST